MLKRDLFTCLSCEELTKSYKIVKPYHISLTAGLEYELDNGISLCTACHKWLCGGDYELVCRGLIVEQKLKRIKDEKESN